MDSATLRDTFIKFFKDKKHQQVSEAPLVVQDDPTLLFVNSGMCPFKSIFLGEKRAEHARVVDSQPCLRVAGKHNDLEEVGHDTYHHTLFEMLGNWSFGDYFKEEAVAWAWELLTSVYKIPEENLYATYFEGAKEEGLAEDKEVYGLWAKFLPAERILPGNKKDNFWEMGATGPCGPCSELHIDLRSEAERKRIPGHTLVNQDHPEVVEIWNLVFMQFHRKADGSLQKLDKQHVDTGMGLERLAMVLQGKRATYDTDLFAPIIAAIAKASETRYGQDPQKDIALRVIADHLRAIVFTIAYGGQPGPQKAGYVIRRILRRAIRYGYTHLHFQEPFLHQLVPLVVQLMESAYPHLRAAEAFIITTVQQEEKSFFVTLKQGIKKLDEIIQSQPKGQGRIDGHAAFVLYDTYGFPKDLTALIAREHGLEMDWEGFDQAMKVQQTRSKQAATMVTSDWMSVTKGGNTQETRFVGYDTLQATSHILRYREVTTPQQRYYQLVLDQTPFYPECGGQVGDIGTLTCVEETVEVFDTKKENETIVHYVKTLPKQLEAPYESNVDSIHRRGAANNHSATHLLDAALREEFGEQIDQKGSLVHPERLRFDFSCHTKPTREQLQAVEDRVNRKIRDNIQLEEFRDTPFAKAKQMGAIMLPGEKYGEKVRVVRFEEGFSTALCGGTHVPYTGQLGFFKITGHSAVAAGVRRIEAVTGLQAAMWVQTKQDQLHAIQKALANTQDPVQGVLQLQEAHATLKKKLAKHEKNTILALQRHIIAALKPAAGGQQHAILHLPTDDVGHLQAAVRQLMGKQKATALVLSSNVGDKGYLLIARSRDLEPTHHAQELLQALLPHLQGKGGGNAHFAFGAGKKLLNPERLHGQARELLG